jgi:menaquinone-dependent protoporphyrinogen oxidase
MAEKTLIAYGTKYGATKEIAEKIGEVLKAEGISNDVLSADKVKDLSPYKNVIIGTAVYMGMGRKEVKIFLKNNAAALKERNVYFFATGPSGKGDPIQLVKGAIIPVNMKELVAGITFKDTTVFHGCLDVARMKGLEKWIVKRVGGDTGDFRDWDMIIAWAKKTAAAIKK